MSLTFVAQMRSQNHPSKEHAPADRCKSRIMSSMHCIKFVRNLSHWRRSEKWHQHSSCAYIPSDLYLPFTQLCVFEFSQEIAEEDAHCVDRKTMRWKCVHQICRFKELLDTLNEQQQKKIEKNSHKWKWWKMFFVRANFFGWSLARCGDVDEI